MPEYLIESPHTPEECLAAYDETLAEGRDVLAKFRFGCATGDHTDHAAYGFVEASGQDEARAFVPARLRHKATLREVAPVTPQQIEEYHRQAMAG